MEVYVNCKCLVLHKDHQNNKQQWLHGSLSEVCVCVCVFYANIQYLYIHKQKTQKKMVKCSRAVA